MGRPGPESPGPTQDGLGFYKDALTWSSVLFLLTLNFRPNGHPPAWLLPPARIRAFRAGPSRPTMIPARKMLSKRNAKKKCNFKEKKKIASKKNSPTTANAGRAWACPTIRTGRSSKKKLQSQQKDTGQGERTGVRMLASKGQAKSLQSLFPRFPFKKNAFPFLALQPACRDGSKKIQDGSKHFFSGGLSSAVCTRQFSHANFHNWALGLHTLICTLAEFKVLGCPAAPHCAATSLLGVWWFAAFQQ